MLKKMERKTSLLTVLLLLAGCLCSKETKAAEAAGPIELERVANGQRVLSAKEIAAIAKEITVRIEGPGSPGSGVIIGKEGKSYVVLTAWHVIRDTRKGEEIAIVTSNNKKEGVDIKAAKQIGNLDLAILKFESDEVLSIAKFGDRTRLSSGDPVYVSGYPLPTTAVPKPIWRFLDGRVISNTLNSLPGGYEILYTNQTLPGMSGGAVLTERGGLIGIHGKAETDATMTEQEGIAVKTGTNQGIPVSYALRELGLKSMLPSGYENSEADNLIAQANGIANKVNEYLESFTEDQRDNLMFVSNITAQMMGPAMELVEKAIKLDRNNGYFYYIRGLYASQFVTRGGRKPCDDYKDAIKLDPSIYEAMIGLGRCWNEEVAISSLRNAIELRPDKEIAYLVLASRTSDLKERAEVLSKAVKAVPLSSRLHEKLASAYKELAVDESEIQMKKLLKSKEIVHLDSAIRLDPTNLEAFKARAIAKASASQHYDAISDWEHVIRESKRKLTWMYLAKAESLLALGLRDKAIDELSKGLSLDFNTKWNMQPFQKSLFIRARLLREKGLTQAACKDVQQGLLNEKEVWIKNYSFRSKGWWTKTCEASR